MLSGKAFGCSQWFLFRLAYRRNQLLAGYVLVVMPLVSIMKDQVEDLIRQSLRGFAIGLRDEKGEKTFICVSIFIVGRLELVVGIVH